MKRFLCSFAVCVCIASFSISPGTYGISPSVWRISSFEDFSKGETEKVAIHHPGRIRLASSFDTYSEIGESAVWCLVESGDGKTLYAGTGTKAEIYKIPVDPDAATGEAELFASLEGSTVQAMVLGEDGNLYAGVSPSGKVYKIAPDGAVTLVGASKEKYIWGIVFDSEGNLILATGDQGKILEMNKDGEVEEIADLGEKHILSLVRDEKGNLYFGTSPGGWVGVVDETGDLRVLYDSEKNETKALAIDEEGNLFAGIIPTVKVEPPRDAPTPAGLHSGGSSDKSSDLVKITPEGNPVRLATTDKAAINALHFWNGRVVLGTGDEGKLFGLGEYRQLDLLLSVDSKEILAILPRKQGGVWLATGNPATILVLPQGTNEGGVYASTPLDAETTAQWGMMTWVAEVPEGATLDFQTRSGNTEEPDDTWSEWSEPVEKPSVVSSPNARYLQWRARFGGTEQGDSATIEEVEVVYQRLNQAPVITSVQIGKGGSSKSSSKSSNGSSGSKSSNGSSSKGSSSTQTGSALSVPITWKASDPNGDSLKYVLSYREIGENLWKEIEKDLTTTKHTWNLVGLPDGLYELHLRASDEASNPSSMALQDEWTSEPFKKDSTAPEVTEWKDAKPEQGTFSVQATMRDALSRLIEAEVVVDGKQDEARPVLPVDGILDELEESFQIRVEGLEPGEHSLTLRAKDEIGNIGADSIRFTLP